LEGIKVPAPQGKVELKRCERDRKKEANGIAKETIKSEEPPDQARPLTMPVQREFCKKRNKSYQHFRGALVLQRPRQRERKKCWESRRRRRRGEAQILGGEREKMRRLHKRGALRTRPERAGEMPPGWSRAISNSFDHEYMPSITSAEGRFAA